MQTPSQLLLCSTLLAMSSCCLHAVAGHPWGQSGYDSLRSSRSPNNGPNGANGITIAWKQSFATANPQFEGIVVGSSGLVFASVGSNEVVAMNGDSGAVQWSVQLGGTHEVGDLALDCTGALYASMSNGVYSINALTGAINWFAPGPFGGTGSVTFGMDGSLLAFGGSTIVSLDRVKGVPLWSYAISSGNLGPAVGPNGTLYISTHIGVYAFVASASGGDLLWRFSPPTGSFEFFPIPTVGPSGIIYVGCWDHNMYALTPQGTILWSFSAGGVVDTAAALGADGTVYFSSWDGNMYAVNGKTGVLVWKTAIFPPTPYTRINPLVDARGIIYSGTPDGYMVALNPVDGSLLWKTNVSNGNGALAMSAALGANGMLYAMTSSAVFAFA
jgi:glucose dehydrogenase